MYESIILLVVLYGYLAWSLTLLVKDENKLKECGNRFLRRIFELKRDEMT
jgi:hypothetical protein